MVACWGHRSLPHCAATPHILLFLPASGLLSYSVLPTGSLSELTHLSDRYFLSTCCLGQALETVMVQGWCSLCLHESIGWRQVAR